MREAASVAERLARAAVDWQARQIVPHCARCAEPCCRLRTVVLELDWPRLCALYRIDEPQRVFDARLAAGTGPVHIRKQGRQYFAHGQPCPAFDVSTHRCTVYGSPLKPPSCTDFPVYLDGDVITADRRCEAVDVEALRAHLSAVAGVPVVAEPDRAFPELVALRVRPPRRRRHKRDRARSSS